MLAAAAVHEPAPTTAAQWLLDQQISGGAGDGGWNDGFFTTNGAVDDTAISIMALLANGTPLTDSNIISATSFLSRTQLATGGWEYSSGLGESANSTALALQALAALGENFYTGWQQNGLSPLDALFGWQSHTGAFQSAFGGAI